MKHSITILFVVLWGSFAWAIKYKQVIKNMTVLTESEVVALFDHMASQKKIPFAYLEDGCAARAHAMSQIMEKEGVISGKVFIEGSLAVDAPQAMGGMVYWSYHVAPFVLMQIDREVVPVVLDPSTFKMPVSVEKWVDNQTRFDRKPNVYYQKRFNYKPEHKNLKLVNWRSKDIRVQKYELMRFKIALKQKKGY